MATMNGKTIEDFLKDGMEQPLPDWFQPFTGRTDIQNNSFILAKANFRTPLETNLPAGWPNDIIPLPYLSGNIAYVPIEIGKCVISHPFTGCYMASYTWVKPGSGPDITENCVCHIARGDGAGELCLDNYNAAPEIITRKRSFSPAGIIDLLDEDKARNYMSLCLSLGFKVDLGTDIYGIITDQDECYSFIVGREKSDLAKIHVMSWVPWDACVSKGKCSSIDSDLNHYLETGTGNKCYLI